MEGGWILVADEVFDKVLWGDRRMVSRKKKWFSSMSQQAGSIRQRFLKG